MTSVPCLGVRSLDRPGLGCPGLHRCLSKPGPCLLPLWCLGHRVPRRAARLHELLPAFGPAVPDCLGKRSIGEAGFCSSSAGFIPGHTPASPFQSRPAGPLHSSLAPVGPSALRAVNFQSRRRSQAQSILLQQGGWLCSTGS